MSLNAMLHFVNTYRNNEAIKIRLKALDRLRNKIELDTKGRFKFTCKKKYIEFFCTHLRITIELDNILYFKSARGKKLEGIAEHYVYYLDEDYIDWNYQITDANYSIERYTL